jgi:hypothetical protein
MRITAKFCSRCRERLSYIQTRNDLEIQFYWASVCRPGAVTQEGLCENCGRKQMLTYYQLPSWP